MSAPRPGTESLPARLRRVGQLRAAACCGLWDECPHADACGVVDQLELSAAADVIAAITPRMRRDLRNVAEAIRVTDLTPEAQREAVNLAALADLLDDLRGES